MGTVALQTGETGLLEELSKVLNRLHLKILEPLDKSPTCQLMPTLNATGYSLSISAWTHCLK